MKQNKINQYQKIVLFLMLIILQTSETVSAETREGKIVIDGNYQDWDAVPHTSVGYPSWNNSNYHEVGLYLDDEDLYVHIQMNDLYGSQLPMNYMVLTVNGQKSFAMSIHFTNHYNQVDWSKDSLIYKMPVGTEKNLGVFSDGSYYYLGEAAFTVYNSSHRTGDELEYSVSLDVVSKITGVEVESIRFIEMKFPNIGAGSVSISGTSTYAVAGILISTSLAGVVYSLIQKRKKEKRRTTRWVG